jgi:hypothetical protein
MTKNKTKTLSAQVAVSKTESGMDYVQVMPDNPCAGQVEPFSGNGHGQLLDNGTFDFVRRRRVRRKPILKQLHSSISYGQDGIDRYVFYLPAEQRDEFAKILKRESQVAAKFMENRKE